MQTRRVIIRFFIFAGIGLVMEVLFTATFALIDGDWNMHGRTSPWMMLDYGLLGIVTMWLARPMMARRIPLPLRAVVYMLGIFLVEYVSGMVFTHVLGLKIWDYSHLAYDLHGQITLLYAPFWYLLGLCVEFLYRRVDACAVTLARGFTAEELESIRTL
jgi:uncharacterized membrane protein